MRLPSPSSAPRRWLMPLVVLALAACTQDEAEVRNNAFPGQVSVGGATSGEVIANAKSSNTKSGSEGPEGTPGIPQGSGGTTSGPNMGGTTQNESGGPAPEGSGKQNDADRGDASQGEGGNKKAEATAAEQAAKAKAEAEEQKQQLAAAMDRSAARYQARQAAAGGGGQSGQPPAGAAQTPAQAGPLGDRVGASQEPPRSEKHGTAPASEDVKQPQQQSPQESGASLPSDAYKSED